jgi:hypothetical protein
MEQFVTSFKQVSVRMAEGIKKNMKLLVLQ